MRREKLENLVTTGMIEAIRSRGKKREKILDGLTKWLKAGRVTDVLISTKDRDAWKTMTDYFKEHGILLVGNCGHYPHYVYFCFSLFELLPSTFYFVHLLNHVTINFVTTRVLKVKNSSKMNKIVYLNVYPPQ